MNRRLAAIASLVLLAASVVLAVVVGVQRFPRGLSVLACVVLALLAAWWALVHRGAARFAAAAGAGVLLAGAVVLVVLEGRVLEDVLILAGLVLSVAAARRCSPSTRGSRSRRRRSGRCCSITRNRAAGRRSASRSRARLARAAWSRSSCTSAMTSRRSCATRSPTARTPSAWRAATARRRSSPRSPPNRDFRTCACRPGRVTISRSISASTATTSWERSTRSPKGGERLVDLAEVNGRVFVNNVSLGVYAEAVQREGYRDAKLRTIAETMPTVLGPGGDALDLRFTGADGREQKTSAVVLVSNNPYRLGRAIASGTRPRLDAGVLGITVLGAGAARDGEKRVQQWSAPSFEVRSDGPVAAGIDGEALKLDPPLRFRTRPQALRVRIAPQHPGASPSATMPESPWDAIRAVARIATHGSS